ncbi:Crp/Fnr family transcriptional regulator [Tumebacillus sp. ITR2]|uniref:Crp/Fnr family transcriptional regulator n=1 Tax=Tumebacillus amylolyticus TaxID=2801339 RepID=A0ABS1JEU8_9BACL|nr:Crp/Fnr family transcriptional regulator [Tumebacillus amylolyticus]MBL0388773.1 Crp/Fnr family transcriptional regulator [Tumebacillus amylolyticus]
MSEICEICSLKTYELFKDLNEEELDQLGRGSTPTMVPKREYIFTPDEPSNQIYMLKSGRVRISRLSETGKHFTLVILEPGDIFGESALFDDEPRRNFAEALDDAQICMIDKREFEKVALSNPSVSLKIAQIVEHRLTEAQEQIENLVFYDVQTRLARLLLKLADIHGERVEHGVQIGIKLTHEDIASLIGSTRETTSKILNEFKAHGWIDVKKRQIILLDQKVLAEMK